MADDSIAVTAVHLYCVGEYVHVSLEIGRGRWVEVARERNDGAFSHIVEVSGIRKAASLATVDAVLEVERVRRLPAEPWQPPD